MLVELLPFYEALCADFFDEDVEAADWNYDDYFVEKVKQAINEITNPLGA
jgi:poly(3-hydroxyalkanoate) synthetase